MRPLPLDGIRVLDFGQALQGPYAGFLLAMAGAEVIKIEPPGGELMRRAGPRAAYSYELNNHNKRSIVVDLKAAGAVALVEQLVRSADIVIENFAPGVMDRLGIGPVRLLEVNPKVVVGSGYGYGSDSRRRDQVAMDGSIQAMSGLMAATGSADGPPMRAGAPVADVLSGTHLFGAVVTALFDAQRTGIGRIVEVAMLETMFALFTVDLGVWHGNGGHLPERLGNAHGLAAPYGVFETQSGPVQLMCSTDAHWAAAAKVISPTGMACDPRFHDGAGRVKARAEIDHNISAWMAEHEMEEVLFLLGAARVPIAPVRTLLDLINDDDLQARGFLSWIDHPTLGSVPMARSAMHFEDSKARCPQPAAALGADTDAVLGEVCQLSKFEIEALRDQGIIF